MAVTCDVNGVLERLQVTVSEALRPCEAEALAREAYSLIGPEYYQPIHITCRNFDETIEAFLAEHPLGLRPGCRYLEVGCGRSRVLPFRRPDLQLVLLDLCDLMLEHSLQADVRCASALLASAFRLPFRDQVFETVFAFLADPFLHPTYLAEAKRTLRSGGTALHIVPAYEWGAALRSSRRAPMHFSHFFRGAREAFGPSFLMPKADLIELLGRVGFGCVSVTDLFLPRTVTRISPDISVPADLQHISPYELPLLTVIEAVAR